MLWRVDQAGSQEEQRAYPEGSCTRRPSAWVGPTAPFPKLTRPTLPTSVS